MDFPSLLNAYLLAIGCTAAQLSQASGISAGVLSRYRSGKRTPPSSSEQVTKIANGLATLASAQGIQGYQEDDISHALCDAIDIPSSRASTAINNLNALFITLKINTADMARVLNYDPSFLSRIRAGKRHPADAEGFVSKSIDYILCSYRRTVDKAAVASLTGIDPVTLAHESAYRNYLYTWIWDGEPSTANPTRDFLHKLDMFDLAASTSMNKLSELTQLPDFALSSSPQSFEGIEGMRAGEIAFFKHAIDSKTCKRLFMCSDMPMEDLSEDQNFVNQWIFGISTLLKQGVQLDVIHNIDRPFNEMILGLVSWIPLYMTGQISPFYLPKPNQSAYKHLLYVADKIAMAGESIEGHHDHGSYSLTQKKHKVAYYAQRRDDLMSHALPLMEIYTSKSSKAFLAALKDDANSLGNRRRVLSSLPLHTLPESCLTSILEKNKVTESAADVIKRHVKECKSMVQTILANSTIADTIAQSSQEQFEQNPISLSLANIFYEQNIYYSYEDYQRHLEATLEYAQNNENYSVIFEEIHHFNNIQILLHENKSVLLSKSGTPTIHFAIYHPQLRIAIENLTLLLTED